MRLHATWKNGRFSSPTSPFIDKISDIRGAVLKVVISKHLSRFSTHLLFHESHIEILWILVLPLQAADPHLAGRDVRVAAEHPVPPQRGGRLGLFVRAGRGSDKSVGINFQFYCQVC